MSKSDITMINDNSVDGLKDHLADNEIYKNLRRHSPLLAFILLIFLPLLLFFFNITCTLRHPIVESFQHVHDMFIFDVDCLAIVLGWLLIQSAFFSLIRKQYYHHNGIIAFVFSLGGVYILNWFEIIHASYIYDNIHKILVASIIVSYFIGLLLFIKGNETRYLKQINPIVAFFYGTDINLTITGIDLKLFFELRIGLIGWACLNLCFFLKTIELYTYRRPPAFVLVVIQQILQALQLIWYEDIRLRNNNTKKETIGFIHIFGSLCWFPFLWCLPSQYLILVNYPIKRLYIIVSVILFLLGMFISRRSIHYQQEISSKKNTKSYGLISLISNYWTLCRHPYYLGICLLEYIFMMISFLLFRKFANTYFLDNTLRLNAYSMDVTFILSASYLQ
ncbi:unnamed protein product [Adineta steineri]|uniref:Uncharacterized protein n=1 Tax=Adineta steineri TaxID=433720 RepID=A0A814DKI4_9BILA|nr:unnamed protein product [Adineta steineri]CAF0965074.1 unnamed protein product [Adineta steineri]